MLNNSKEKENSSKELFNKWEGKAIFNNNNSTKLEDNSKAKEEKVLLFKLLY